MEKITYSYKLYGGKQLKKSLSKEEQKKYLELAVQGDYEAQEKIFEHNLRLVSNIINKYYYKEDLSQKEELFQIGSLGLWKSIKYFNIDFNVEFSTYAVPMILGEIRRYLRDNNSPIRIARSIKDLAYKALMLQEEYLQKNIELTPKQMAEILEESEEDIKDALIAVQQVSSFEEQVFSNKDGKSINLGESIPDSNVSLEEQFEEKERNELVLKVLNSLGERESLVVRKLFGIGCKQKTQMKISDELGISQGQVSRIYRKTLKRLNTILPKYLKGELKFELLKNTKNEQQNTETEKATTKQETIFDLYPKYTKKEILGAINSLNDINKKTIKLKYGINNSSCYSNQEIAEQLGEKRHIIGSRIGNIKNQITKKLEKGQTKIETIFDLYLEYTEEQIIEAINKLSAKNKEIIELKYGLNGNEVTSNKEIALKFNLKPGDSTSTRIWLIKKQIKNHLDRNLPKKATDKNSNRKKKTNNINISIFKLFGEYKEEQVLDAINILSEENKKIIELKFGLNGNKTTSNIEIGKIFHMNETSVAARIYSIKRQISRVLKNGFPKEEQIIDVFKGYKEEEILQAIETLSEENKKIISLKYGLNGYTRIGNKEISKLLNIEHCKIGSRINTIKLQIYRKLKNGLKEETIFDLYPTYTKEEILKAISKLEDIKRLIIELKYGLNGNSKKENSEIAKILKLEPKVVGSKLGISKTQIKRKLKQGSEKFMRTQSIHQMFPEYTEEQILGAISTLDDKEKFIIELKYGLNGRQAIGNTEIGKLLGEKNTTINNKIFLIKSKIAKKLEKGQIKKETIFDLFPEYTEEQILGAISTLSEESQEIIELKYGLNGKEESNYQEIEKKLNINEKTIKGKIINIKKQIIQRLQKGKTKVETIFDLFPEYTEEQVLYVINSLKTDNKQIIELKYGLNGNNITSSKEIAEQYGYTSTAMAGKIYQLKNQIAKKLEKKFTKINKETVNPPEVTNANEDLEVLDFDEKPKNELSYQTKVKELEETILQNKKIGDSVFKIGGVNVRLKIARTTCLFATLDTRTNTLNRAHGLKKDCYVYRITAVDSKDVKLYEKFLVKDPQTGKFFNFVYRYTNGEYDLSNMKYNELVCYDMQGIHVEQIYVKEPEMKKVISTPKTIIRDSFTRKKEEKETKSESIEESPQYKLALEKGMKLFKERQIVLAEEQFIKALSSKQRFVLQKSNYYLGRIYFMKKKGIIAEKYLKASLEINAKSYPVLFEMGKALALQRKYEEAIKCFDECETLAKPNYINHVIEKAKCYIELGNTTEGLKILNAVQVRFPNDYFICFEKGNLFFNLNKFDEARKELEKCEKLIPNYSRHKAILGKIEYLENNFEKANDLFNEVVEIDLSNNVIYGIVNIAYFFHNRGEKELAYKYYSKAPKVNNWLTLSKKEAEEHIQNHNQYTEGQVMHSVFNFEASLEILNSLIKNMEKTTTREVFDVYQVHCENAGYMVIDGENNTKKEDYITILTLPFTKTIANAYPDDKMEGVDIKRTVKLDWLIKFAENLKANSSQTNQQEKTKEETIIEQPAQRDKNEEVEVIVEESLQDEAPNNDSSTKSSEMVIDNSEEQPQPSTKVVVEETETTIIKGNFELPINLEFEKNKPQVKTLINMLNDPTEQVVLLLRLGYINDKHYTPTEIGEFLNISEQEVHNIINSSLSNLINFSISMTSQKIEDTHKQLGITKNLTLN